MYSLLLCDGLPDFGMRLAQPLTVLSFAASAKYRKGPEAAFENLLNLVREKLAQGARFRWSEFIHQTHLDGFHFHAWRDR